ncbi:ABC transporter substrate-binding protein [Sporosarcina ureilytica]|uniref:Sugar ABC transporter substrate-binding protein n=1 Tax=Sporosarcina ureilytica TaxID=298596 RepID=A0A1D8JIW9_9BACL|nr:ABC transporter substrate-binding protein [Sporosarcina ureilytica]AOV08647.1 sugar ABC transporter substrate-binding protein [Sporosarcina ureilytica]
MKSKKSFFRIVLIMLVAVLALVGCSSSNDSDQEKSSVDQVTIDIMQFKVEIKDQFEDLVKVYEEENPGVKINVKTIGGGNDYGSTLKAAISAGDEPAIFNVGGPSDVEEYREFLADLADTDAVEAALDGTLTAVQEDDKILGLPVNQEGYGLIYNKNVFEEAGINAEDIVSFEDLQTAVETLDKQKDELGLDAVFALPAKELWVLGDHISNMFIAPEFNNDIQEAYHAETIAFEKGDELKRYLDLQNKYSVQPILSLDYSQQVEQLFSLEKVAMIQQGNWVYNSVYDMDPEFAENGIGILPVPVEGFEGHVPAGVPMFWAVNGKKDDEIVQASKDFLDWLYTSETGKNAVLEDFKFIPAYKDYDVEKISDPLSKQIYEFAEAGKTFEGWVYQGTPTGWNQETLGVNIQKYLSGDMEWDEVISKSIEKWETERQ